MLLHRGTLGLISRLSTPDPPLLCKTALLIGVSILSSHFDLACVPRTREPQGSLCLMSCFSHPGTSLWDPTQPGIGQPHSEHQQHSKLQYRLLAEPRQGPSFSSPDLPRTSLTAVHAQRCPQPHTCSFQARGHLRPYLDARSVPGLGVSSLT